MAQMTKAFRDAWYLACTDGSYRQLRGELADAADGKLRCCLGVAHAVAKKMGIVTSDTYFANKDEEPI